MKADEEVRALIQGAQEGDRRSFDDLVELYQPRIQALVLSRLGKALRQGIEAEDIIQETLLRAFHALGQFHWEGEESFLRWLGGIAEHQILDEARRRAGKRTAPLGAEIRDPGISQSRALRRTERFDRLQEALRTLSPEHRQVIVLARIEGLPLKEIAARMDRSPDAVSSLLRRAVKSLKASFGNTDSFHLPPRHLGNGETSHE